MFHPSDFVPVAEYIPSYFGNFSHSSLVGDLPQDPEVRCGLPQERLRGLVDGADAAEAGGRVQEAAGLVHVRGRRDVHRLAEPAKQLG